MALVLYHNPISTCSQKVRLALAEKGLSFESHVINFDTARTSVRVVSPAEPQRGGADPGA